MQTSTLILPWTLYAQHFYSLFLRWLTDFRKTGSQFTVNGVAYTSPTVPVLLQMLSGAKNPNELLPSGSIYNLPPNKSVEISIPAGVVGGNVRRTHL